MTAITLSPSEAERTCRLISPTQCILSPESTLPKVNRSGDIMIIFVTGNPTTPIID